MSDLTSQFNIFTYTLLQQNAIILIVVIINQQIALNKSKLYMSTSYVENFLVSLGLK